MKLYRYLHEYTNAFQQQIFSACINLCINNISFFFINYRILTLKEASLRFTFFFAILCLYLDSEPPVIFCKHMQYVILLQQKHMISHLTCKQAAQVRQYVSTKESILSIFHMRMSYTPTFEKKMLRTGTSVIYHR